MSVERRREFVFELDALDPRIRTVFRLPDADDETLLSPAERHALYLRRSMRR